MRNIAFLVLLLALSFTVSAGTITIPLYDNWGGTSDCSSSGDATSCSFFNWWSNGTRTDSIWSGTGTYTDGTVWVSAGKSTQFNYNWGTTIGGNWWTVNNGAGWNVSDYFNQYITNGGSTYADTNGYVILSGSNDNQLVHAHQYVYDTWNCTVTGHCHEVVDVYPYVVTNDTGSGSWTQYLYGQYYSSDSWQNNTGNTTSDHYTYSFEWDRGGTVPEPNTVIFAAIGGGMMLSMQRLRRHYRNRKLRLASAMR